MKKNVFDNVEFTQQQGDALKIEKRKLLCKQQAHTRYERNKEEYLNRSHQYYLKNKEAISAYKKKWYAERKVKHLKAAKKAWKGEI